MQRIVTAYEQLAARYHDVASLLRERGDEIIRGSFEGDPDEGPPAVAIEVGDFSLLRDVDVEVGSLEPFDVHTVRLPFSWRARQHAQRFPRVEAAVEVTALSNTPPVVELALFASYQVPFGIVGTIADELTGHRLVEAVGRRLLVRMRDHLERELSRTASLVD